jgi:stage II sporulation protein D
VTVLRRGKSGRAAAVAVVGDAGSREVDGYRFRMSLGLPDTLFVVSRRETPDGPVAHFVGRGWGHGIGMCQNGAYGLAQGGADCERILTWYYTGAVLAAPAGEIGGVDE